MAGLGPVVARGALGVGRGLAFGTLLAGHKMATGKRRHWWVPLWVTAGVAACSLAPVPLALALLSLQLAIRANLKDLAGVKLSEREWRLFANSLVAGAVWLVWSLFLETEQGWRWGLLAAGGVAYGLPWWQGRRIRPAEPEPEPDPLPPLVAAWPRIAEHIPPLAGVWLEWDPETSAGVLDLDRGRADREASRAGDVESILKTRAGAIRMRPDPEGPVNRMIVQFLPNPLERATRVDYAEGVEIDERGRLWLGNSTDEKPWYLPLFREDGAAHIVITGSTGAGKGGTTNLIVTAMCRDPRFFTIGIDLKGGTGIPALREGLDIYARTPDEARLALEINHDISRARKDRYGELGRDTWTPADDPMVSCAVDEAFRLRGLLKPREIANLEEDAAQGRSLGLQLLLATQRGDGNSLVSPTLRSNLMGGGTALMHRPGDSMARILAAQDFDVDPDLLPKAAGWAYPLSGIDPTAVAVPVRVRHIPTDKNRTDGKPAPHGTVQDWLHYAQHADLHPADSRIAARWDNAPAPAVDPRSLIVAPTNGEQGRGEPLDTAGDAPTRATLHPFTPSPLPTEDAQEADDSSAGRILALLDQGPKSRAELAAELGITPRRVSQLLARMETAETVERADGVWRKTA